MMTCSDTQWVKLKFSLSLGLVHCKLMFRFFFVLKAALPAPSNPVLLLTFKGSCDPRNSSKQASLEVVRTWKWGEKDKRFIHGKVIQGADIPVSLHSDRSSLLTHTARTGLTRNLGSNWHMISDCKTDCRPTSLYSWHNNLLTLLQITTTGIIIKTRMKWNCH